MSESQEHYNYVCRIIKYVQRYIATEKKSWLKTDLFGCEKPSLIYNKYVPDVMYCDNDTLIIGEAKTIKDYNTEHSYKQYEAYMKECSLFPGEAIIVVYVPWQLSISASNHFKLLKEKYSCNPEIIILSDLEMEVQL